MGDPSHCNAARSDPAKLRFSPSTRIPLPSHAAAAACPEDTGPASLRHSGRRALPRCGARHRISPLSRTKPRATACCVLHARPIVRPARVTARRSAMAVEDTPPFARDRDVALGALAARRPHCRAIAARHVGHLPVPSHARHFVRQRPRKAASERGGLYHAVITLASVACLADPLPPLAWRPLLPPVTTPFRTNPHRISNGFPRRVVTGGRSATPQVCPVPAIPFPRIPRPPPRDPSSYARPLPPR